VWTCPDGSATSPCRHGRSQEGRPAPAAPR
jgi:hypothetical protein